MDGESAIPEGRFTAATSARCALLVQCQARQKATKLLLKVENRQPLPDNLALACQE